MLCPALYINHLCCTLHFKCSKMNILNMKKELRFLFQIKYISPNIILNKFYIHERTKRWALWTAPCNYVLVTSDITYFYPVEPVIENEPTLIPRMSGWTRAISFVGVSQSCYGLQIFVWERMSQKLSHQNRKSFLPCFLDPSHGEAISTARRYRRNSRVWRNTTFFAIVCCEW